jgi:IS5 family transposase
VTDWPSYNRSLVRRGEILFSHGFLDEWDTALTKMNENKKGRKFVYPGSFILAVGYVRIYFHLPYRQTEGIIKATGRSLPSHPSYGHMCKRVNSLKVDFNSSIKTDDDDLMIAIDSTGIKATNRGQWMSEKWGGVRDKKKKGYLKIHVAVNTKTREILALEVTDEKAHDGTMMRKLVKHALNSHHHHGEKAKSVVADGAYDSNANFKFLTDEGIKPAIKVKRNSVVSTKNSKARNGEARQQTRDLLKWKRKRRYGHRWMAETAFSSIKRMFGEHVSSTRFQNMVKEMMMKVSLYNLFTRLA